MTRSDGRMSADLRPTRLTPGFLLHAEGSVLIEVGRTRVICSASVEDRVPPFLRNTGKGWVTAEYGMLPARHLDAHAARSHGRQGRRAHAGDPAADRTLAAIGRAPARARRADDLGRLRRDSGRRRHAHRVDYRRVRRHGARHAAHARGGTDQDDSRPRLRRRHERRRRRRHADAGPRLRRRLARRRRHEHRQDRRRPIHRSAGHRRRRRPSSARRSTI